METTSAASYKVKGTGSAARLFQVASGIFLMFFVGAHLYVAHINFGHPVQLFNSVIQNLHNPWWLAFFIVFVWIITYHALNGIGGVVKDVKMSQNAKRFVDISLTVIYFATCIYGTILSIIVAGMALPA